MFNSLSSWCYLLYLKRKIQNKKGRTEKIDGYVYCVTSSAKPCEPPTRIAFLQQTNGTSSRPLTEKAERGRESDELPPNERVGRERRSDCAVRAR